MQTVSDLTTDERETAKALATVLRNRKDVDGMRAAMRASREKHGERHELVKAAALWLKNGGQA